jgi:flagellar basal-body rod modification protein FlgD
MDVTQTSVGQTGGATARSGAVITSDYETFLLMLTTQMQNQDPLNPIESSDYAVQLATFSGVEQQVKTNELLETLSVQMGVMGMAQLAGWVGMDARAAVPAWFDGESPVTIAPNPALVADQATLVVYDAAAREVSRREITVSADQIEWSGKRADGSPLPPGLYSFRLESRLNGELVSNDAVETYSRIVEARGENGDTVLVMQGGARISSSAVTALRQPQAASQF